MKEFGSEDTIKEVTFVLNSPLLVLFMLWIKSSQYSLPSFMVIVADFQYVKEYLQATIKLKADVAPKSQQTL